MKGEIWTKERHAKTAAKWRKNNPAKWNSIYDNWKKNIADPRYNEYKKLLDYFRKDGCVRCGSKEYLHFHHTNPETKLFNIAAGWSRNIEKVKQEIAKTVIVCNLCHKYLHRCMRYEKQ